MLPHVDRSRYQPLCIQFIPVLEDTELLQTLELAFGSEVLPEGYSHKQSAVACADGCFCLEQVACGFWLCFEQTACENSSMSLREALAEGYSDADDDSIQSLGPTIDERVRLAFSERSHLSLELVPVYGVRLTAYKRGWMMN